MVAYIPEPVLIKLEPMQRADASFFDVGGGGFQITVIMAISTFRA